MVILGTFDGLGHHFRKSEKIGEGFNGGIQNHLLGDCFENGKGFLGKLIPDQNLETKSRCRNFAKNRLF